MSEGTTEACPHCDHVNITHLVGGNVNEDPEAGDGENYYCRGCGERFDEPVVRELHAASRVTRGPAAQLLDPDVTSFEDVEL